jgi:hypothetical protein
MLYYSLIAVREHVPSFVGLCQSFIVSSNRAAAGAAVAEAVLVAVLTLVAPDAPGSLGGMGPRAGTPILPVFRRCKANSLRRNRRNRSPSFFRSLRRKFLLEISFQSACVARGVRDRMRSISFFFRMTLVGSRRFFSLSCRLSDFPSNRSLPVSFYGFALSIADQSFSVRLVAALTNFRVLTFPTAVKPFCVRTLGAQRSSERSIGLGRSASISA